MNKQQSLLKYNLPANIASYETDAYGQLSLANLLHLFQEAANHHATALGWGLEYLSSVNKFWILSRLKILIDQVPKHKEEIVTSTWPRGAVGFFAYRDYQLVYKNTPSINAVSSWMILDKFTHRPVKIDQLNKELPFHEESFLPFPVSKIPVVEKNYPILERKVYFSDIDINLHVNNAKYVEIISDALSEKLKSRFRIKELDIQYLQESQQGDNLIVYAHNDLSDSSEIFLSIDNSSKGKEACRCCIKLDKF